MDIKKQLGVCRWLLMVGLLAWGTIYGLAQTRTAQPPKPPAQSQAGAQNKTKWIKDPNSVMPMRAMTNAQRRAAAERTRARRAKAEAQRRNSQNGVQR